MIVPAYDVLSKILGPYLTGLFKEEKTGKGKISSMKI